MAPSLANMKPIEPERLAAWRYDIAIKILENDLASLKKKADPADSEKISKMEILISEKKSALHALCRTASFTYGKYGAQEGESKPTANGDQAGTSDQGPADVKGKDHAANGVMVPATPVHQINTPVQQNNTPVHNDSETAQQVTSPAINNAGSEVTQHDDTNMLTNDFLMDDDLNTSTNTAINDTDADNLPSFIETFQPAFAQNDPFITGDFALSNPGGQKYTATSATAADKGKQDIPDQDLSLFSGGEGDGGMEVEWGNSFELDTADDGAVTGMRNYDNL